MQVIAMAARRSFCTARYANPTGMGKHICAHRRSTAPFENPALVQQVTWVPLGRDTHAPCYKLHIDVPFHGLGVPLYYIIKLSFSFGSDPPASVVLFNVNYYNR